MPNIPDRERALLPSPEKTISHATAHIQHAKIGQTVAGWSCVGQQIIADSTDAKSIERGGSRSDNKS
jgi:hypothetical protein